MLLTKNLIYQHMCIWACQPPLQTAKLALISVRTCMVLGEDQLPPLSPAEKDFLPVQKLKSLMFAIMKMRH